MFAYLNKALIIALVLITCFAFALPLSPSAADAAAPVPSITSITPNEGARGETVGVTISGTNLDYVFYICFGLWAVLADASIWTADEVVGNVEIDPGAELGPQDVTLYPYAGSAVVEPGAFIITVGAVNDPPTISSVSPDTGQRGDTLDVTIQGSNLDSVDDVSFGDDILVGSPSVQSSSQIVVPIAIDPLAGLGPRDVTVQNTGVGSDTLDDAFTVTIDWGNDAPTISSVNPDEGQRGDTLDVTIQGSNLDTVDDVSFGSGIIVSGPSSQSSNQIVVPIQIMPDAALGLRDVTVQNTGVGSDTLDDAFTVTVDWGDNPPILSSVNPNEGQRGDNVDVAVQGINLDSVYGVSFGSGIIVNTPTSQSASRIVLPIQIMDVADLGPRDVTVFSPQCPEGEVLPDAFTVEIGPLAISSVSPNHGHQGDDNLEVTIQGDNLDTVNGVSFGDDKINVNSIDILGPGELVVDIDIEDNCPVGPKDVTVTSDDCPEGEVLPDAFTVQLGPPAITSISPYQGHRGDTFDVFFFGTNLDLVTGVQFQGGGITVNSFGIIDANHLSANIDVADDADLGSNDVSASSAEGTGVLPDAFTVKIKVETINDPPVLVPEPPVIAPPNAAFEADKTFLEGRDNAYDVIQFTDKSTGVITSRVWDFGDGTTSTEQNPTHVYDSEGTFTVSLTVTGPGGSDTETKTDYINTVKTGGAICVPTTKLATTTSHEVAIGWGITGLCWGAAFFVLRRLLRRKAK